MSEKIFHVTRCLIFLKYLAIFSIIAGKQHILMSINRSRGPTAQVAFRRNLTLSMTGSWSAFYGSSNQKSRTPQDSATIPATSIRIMIGSVLKTGCNWDRSDRHLALNGLPIKCTSPGCFLVLVGNALYVHIRVLIYIIMRVTLRTFLYYLLTIFKIL